jgi:hypothetical protein
MPDLRKKSRRKYSIINLTTTKKCIRLLRILITNFTNSIITEKGDLIPLEEGIWGIGNKITDNIIATL